MTPDEQSLPPAGGRRRTGADWPTHKARARKRRRPKPTPNDHKEAA